jgi:hypothetical protein
MRSVRRLTIASLVVLSVLGGGLVLSGASASALSFSRQLAGYGVPPLAFGKPQGVAVNASGDLYVAEAENKVVDEFNLSWDPLLPQITGGETPAAEFGSALHCIAVNAGGDVYVADASNAVVDEFEPSGKYVMSLTEVPESSGAPVTGLLETTRCVALGPTGNVYVLEQGHNVVDEFSATGEFLMQVSGAETPAAEFGTPQGIAVGPEEDLYVADSSQKAVDVFEPSGKLKKQITEVPVGSGATHTGPFSGAWNVTVDAKGDLYVVERFANVVDEFNSAGVFLRQLTGVPAGGAPVSGPFSSPEAVVVDSAGDVYVSDAGHKVIDEFSNLPPKVLIQPASNVTASGAKINGTVSPEGQTLTSCEFEYGTVDEVDHHEYNHHQACEQTNIEGETPVAVSTTLAGLALHTVYEYRLAVESISGLVLSKETEDGGFTTSIVPFKFGVPAYASNVTQFSATLNGALDPENTPLAYHFAYIEAAHYNPEAGDPYAGESGAIAPTPDLQTPVNTSEDQVLPQEITGLKPGTTYDFALIASGPLATETGPNATFTTPSIPLPQPLTGTATNINETTASIAGTIDPGGWNTLYTFQYGTTTSYGSNWPTIPTTLGALNGPQNVTANLEGLQPNTTYHYRLAATNPDGTTYSTDQTFTTTPYPLSTIQETPILTTKPTKPPAPVETNEQKLAKAVKTCKKQPKKKRASCEKQARKKYTPTKKHKKTYLNRGRR